MTEDRITKLKLRAQLAGRNYAMLREGREPEITDDALGIIGWRSQREVKGTGELGSKERIQFHVPMTREHRLANAEGATSFHFAHSFINKVSAEQMEDGRRNRPGAARAHARYVERETAVAIQALADDPAIAASPSVEPAPSAGNEEYERETDKKDGFAAGGAGGRSEGTDAGRSFLQRDFEIPRDFASGDDAESGADLRLLSGFELVRRGRQPELLLHAVASLSMDAGEVLSAVRQPRPGKGSNASKTDRVNTQSPSGHDRYIVRGGAVAIQPDGDRVLFTNIDADPDKRAEFWTLVEKHERSSQGDEMSCRFNDNAAFWREAVIQPNCPQLLRDQYKCVDHDKIARFKIDSGKEMRAFLKQQDGWNVDRKRRRAKDDEVTSPDTEAFVKFHDGRDGRVQYRIVGELPDELPMTGKVQILQGFCEEFHRLRLPFVAVMHAPDHTNNEKNWHFHLVYYDRPCARITAAQISELGRNEHDISGLEVGMWDFTAATVKKDRANRERWPLRQKKVTTVSTQAWLMRLRRSFAKHTNVQLTKYGVARRVDPRRHEDMGIIADPQEHLGTRQAATEARGTVTAAGRRNEARQSQAIMGQIEEARANAYADATRRTSEWKRRFAGRSASDNAEPMVEFERNLIAAADLDYLAASLRHSDDRATSRAANLRRINSQLVRAIDADASAGSPRERRYRADITAAADRYLDFLNVALRDDRQTASDCITEAKFLRGNAQRAEGRLADLVNAPAINPAVPIAAAIPSAAAPAGQVEKWLQLVGKARPLILKDDTGFSVNEINAPIELAAAKVQAELGILYRRQQEDIANVVRQLPAHRLLLSTRNIGGRSRRTLVDVAPELASAFYRYQDSPEIEAALHAVFYPEQAHRSGVGSMPRSSIINVLAAQERTPSTLVSETTPPAPKLPTDASAAFDPPPSASPVGGSAERPIRARDNPPVRSEVRAPESIQTAPQKSLDPAQVARDLVARSARLTFDPNNLIDRESLVAAKVAPGMVVALQRNAYLAVRVGVQVDRAVEQVRNHAKLNPLNLIEKDGLITLGGEAPAALVELLRFHSAAPAVQERLKTLYDDLKLPGVSEQSLPAVSSPAVEPEQINAVQPQERVEPEAPISKDILHGEAARRAAQIAAWQRGR